MGFEVQGRRVCYEWGMEGGSSGSPLDTRPLKPLSKENSITPIYNLNIYIYICPMYNYITPTKPQYVSPVCNPYHTIVVSIFFSVILGSSTGPIIGVILG